MTINKERLASDPGYWDEVAPEGAELFVPGSSFEWRKWLGGIEMFFDYEQWLQPIGPWSLSTWLEEKPGCIPRPQKPEVEWDGEGLPPVGQRIEIQSPEDGSWSDVGEVTEIRTFVYTTSMRAGFNSTCNFRVARTHEQRQRDELAVEIWSVDGYSKDHAYNVADHILSRYNLEPKDV